jgi:carbon-monoxide dehydrogenase medium subunit
MKPAPFAYFDPSTVEEAVSLLEQQGSEAKLIAGGQSLVPLLNMRLARPTAVIDLNRIDGLSYIREDDGWLAIGAMTRQREVERSELVRTKQPVLYAATKLIAHPQIRNRGTIGGSLAHADPAAEYPALALALGAELRARGPEGERRIAADDFFVTYLTTALEPSEVVTEVRVPVLAARTGWSVLELSRRHGDFALAGVVALLTLAQNGTIEDGRVVLFGVAATPLRATAAEAMLRGERPGEQLFAETGRAASAAVEDGLSDVHASAEYRKHLVSVLTRRALAEAAGRVAA